MNELNKQQDVAGAVMDQAYGGDIIPMSVPRQRLECPNIPGYVCYWHIGKPDVLMQARQAGYTFVSPEEARLNNRDDLGGDAKNSGSTDLGTRVSVIAGSEIGADGQPVRLYLMKVKKEHWELGEKLRLERSESIARSIRTGQVGALQGGTGETGEDAAQRYVSKPTRTMFHPR